MASSKKFLAKGEKGRIKVGSEVMCDEGGKGCLMKFMLNKEKRVKKNQIETQILYSAACGFL